MGLMNRVNAILATDIPRMRLEEIGRRRPFPYDVAATLALTDGGAPNTFPAGYTALIPAGTYDFGDSPNRIQVVAAHSPNTAKCGSLALGLNHDYADILQAMS